MAEGAQEYRLVAVEEGQDLELPEAEPEEKAEEEEAFQFKRPVATVKNLSRGPTSPQMEKQSGCGPGPMTFARWHKMLGDFLGRREG